MAKILTIGEIMLEFAEIGDGIYKKSFAGDTFNFAYYLNVVSGGVHQVDYLTALGADEISAQCLRFIERHGIGVSKCIRRADRTIGLFMLANDAHGEKQYGYWRGQSAARCLFDSRLDLVAHDWICFSGITAAVLHNRRNLIACIIAAKQQGAKLGYDCNHRNLLWDVDEAIEFAKNIFADMDLIKISDAELQLLFAGETIATLSKSYPKAEWVLTCQAMSEVWQNGSMLAHIMFSPQRKPVDTSAAGDSFFGAYLAAKLSGAQCEDALQSAHKIAAQVVGVKGSIVDVSV